MDMGFALHGQFAGHRSESVADFATSGFDWHGLHSRLTAAHAARRSILASAEWPARQGSFDGEAAAVLAEHEIQLSAPSSAVNPTDLADGKETAGIAEHIAGPTSSGGRGK